MRRSLFTAVAVAPLVLLCGAPVLAATTISGAQTTPENTSTANNGQPDDVTITGSVTVTTPVAVTIDSNNTVSNSGSISISDVDNSTDVLIQGGHTGALVNNSTITNSESYTPTTNSTNGFPDGAYAQGTGRYGVRVTGSSPFVGSLSNVAGATISVNGNNSFGVSVLRVMLR